MEVLQKVRFCINVAWIPTDCVIWSSNESHGQQPRIQEVGSVSIDILSVSLTERASLDECFIDNLAAFKSVTFLRLSRLWVISLV